MLRAVREPVAMLTRIGPDEPPDARGHAPPEREACGQDVVMGEWSLTQAAWTDRHLHEELNYVLDGELHVTYDDQTFVARPGDVVIVPAGKRARYAAPVHARMVYVYGPSTDGHAAFDTEYVEFD
jgi:quercetin dioxygenase-like cupin family protein